MRKPQDYEVVLVDLNNGSPAALAPGVEEIAVRVKAGDAQSAIQIARKVISKSWGYKVSRVAPLDQDSTKR